jgi:glyoxylase-like metal-dependent hydrolase (beta-lactamase superfamily II)
MNGSAPNLSQSMQIGAYSVNRILDMTGVPFALSDVFPGAKESEAHELTSHLESGRSDAQQPNQLLLDFAGYLVRGAGHTILVDTAVGNGKRRKERPAWNNRTSEDFIKNLERAGVTVEDPDLIVTTHLHADHVGWNTVFEDGEWIPTFPGARYLFPGAEVQAIQGRPENDRAGHYGSFEDSVEPLFQASVADLVTGDIELAPGLNLVSMPGHTSGNCVLKISSEGQTGVISGDVIHHEFQLARPDWVTRFCQDGDRAIAVRLELLNYLADTGGYLLPAHFPPSRISRQGAGFVQHPRV